MGNIGKSAEDLSRELSQLKEENSSLLSRYVQLQDDLLATKHNLAQHKTNLLAFHHFSVGLANLPYQDIFPFVVENIRKMFGVSAIWVSRFDIDSMESIIEYSSLTEKQEAEIEKLLGQKIVGFKMPWSQAQYEKLISEDYWYFTSLTELTFGIVPPPVGKVIEEIIGVDWLNGIPLIYQGNLVGKLIIIGNSKQPLPNKEEIILFSGVVANAIGRKRAEEALDLSETRFREMAELLPMIVWETDLDGYFTYVNKLGLKQYGYEEFDLLQHRIHVLACLVPSERSQAEERIKLLLDGGLIYSSEYTAMRLDGTTFPVLVNTQVILYDGKPVGFRGVSIDLTESKKKEEEFSRLEIQLQGVLDSATEVSIIAVNPLGEIRLFNKGAEKMLGYSEAEALGKQIPEFIHPKEEILARENELFVEFNRKIEGFEAFAIRAKGGKAETLECHYVRKNGTLVLVSLVITTLYDDKGEVKGFLGVAIDITQKRNAEKIIKESEEKYRTLMENMNEVVMLVDNDDRVMFVNNKFTEVLGYTPEEIIGKIGYEVLLDVESQSLIVEANNDRKRRVSGQYEIRFQKKGGGAIDFLVSGAPMLDAEGNVVGSIGTMMDISDRKLAEEKLKESQQLFQTLTQSSPVGIFRTNAEGYTTYVNPQTCLLTGLTPEEAEGYGWLRAVHPVDREVMLNSWSSNIQRVDNAESEYRFLKPNGDIVWVTSKSVPEIVDGKVRGYVGTLTDITDRKKAELELTKSQQLFQTLALHSPVAIFRTDAEGYTTYVNPKWCEFSGFSAEKAEGYGWLAAVHPFDRGLIEDAWQAQIQMGDFYETEYRFLKPNGEITWVIGRSVPEIIHGEIKGYVGTLTDITSRKEAEMELLEKTEEINVQNEEYLQLNEELIQMNEELYLAKTRAEESDRLKSAFLANMSHEIRTPMNGIVGFSKILTEPDISREERDEYSNILNNSCQRLLNTVNDILDISKLDSGQMEIRYSIFPPIKVLNELFSSYYDRFKNAGISFDLKVDYRLSEISINADERKVYQVLNNLIDNALKFTPEGGKVTFGFELRDSTIAFFVNDTGIGIAKDLKQFIFGRFNQENLTLSRGHEGTGLGLSICKGLVEMMGGEIFVESEVGKGSTFTIKLPFQTQDELKVGVAHQAERNKDRIDLKKKTVLVAEDDHSSYLLVERILTRDLNAIVVRAKNGYEAVSLFEKHGNEIAVVLMDIKMPLMDGFEATRLIRAMNATVPIVALTAFAMKQDRDTALAAGCNDYISKPITPMQLLAKLRTVIES